MTEIGVPECDLSNVTFERIGDVKEDSTRPIQVWKESVCFGHVVKIKTSKGQ